MKLIEKIIFGCKDVSKLKEDISILENEIIEKKEDLRKLLKYQYDSDFKDIDFKEYIKALQIIIRNTNGDFMKFNHKKDILYLKINDFIDYYKIDIKSKDFIKMCRELGIIKGEACEYYKSVRFGNYIYKCYLLDSAVIYKLMKEIEEA